MNKYEKNILFKLQVFKVMLFFQIFVNLCMPLYSNWSWKFSLFQVIMCFVWIYGYLAATGVICNNTHRVEDDVVIYEQSTSPLILVLFAVRGLELLYYFLFHKNTVNWIAFVILLLIDAISLVMILLDKGSYEYARQLCDSDFLELNEQDKEDLF